MVKCEALMPMTEMPENIAETRIEIVPTMDTKDQGYPLVTVVAEAAALTDIMPMNAVRLGGQGRLKEANTTREEAFKEDKVIKEDKIIRKDKTIKEGKIMRDDHTLH